MKEILEQAKKLMDNLPPRRPCKLQLISLLVGKEPTTQGKLWRILEELRAKITEVESAKDQINDYYDQIEIMKEDKEELKDENKVRLKAKKRMAERRINNSLMQIGKVREIMAARHEEIQILIETYEELIKIEPVKSWDDNNAQSEFWEKKLGMELTLRKVLGLPPDLEVIKAILALPNSIGIKQTLNKSISTAVKELENKNGIE